MKITEFPSVDSIQPGDLLLLDGPRGTKTIPAEKIGMNGSGALYANSFAHEYYLGDHVTPEQLADIRSGAFKIVQVGGYWMINGHKYWAAHADYMLGNKSGESRFSKHHMIVIPNASLLTSSFNANDSTANGYANSDLRKKGMPAAKKIIDTDLGAENILSNPQLLTTETRNGQSSAAQFFDSSVEAMSEFMLFGDSIFGNRNDIGYHRSKLALFVFRPDLILDTSTTYWTSTISTANTVVKIDMRGILTDGYAEQNQGVRPYFLLG